MLAGNVGYVFQNPDDQIFKYNVMDEILFGPLNIGMDAERAKKEAERALKLTGLTGKEKENPYDLELYERKMTAIASVLAMDTDVLILDEPTIAQDWKDGRSSETSSAVSQSAASWSLPSSTTWTLWPRTLSASSSWLTARCWQTEPQRKCSRRKKPEEGPSAEALCDAAL